MAIILTDDTLPQGVTPALMRRFERTDRLAKKYADMRTRAADAIKAAFGRGTYVYGSIVIERVTANVMDPKAFQKAYPADKYPEYYKLTLDTKAIPDEIREPFLVEQERAKVAA